jgi:arsenite methyltransferase
MSFYLNEGFDLESADVVSVLDEIPIWSAPFGIKVLDVINYRQNITALDIGCGTGFPLIELAQRLGSSSRVYGIDPWSSAAERVRLKLNTMNIRNVTLLTQEAETLPFEENTFDLIVSNNGINNVQDADKVLSECKRTLKPGGQFVMSVNLPGTMIEFYDIFRRTLSNRGMTEDLKAVDSHIYSKRKPLEEHKEKLCSNFIIENIIEDSFAMRYSSGTAFLNHYFIKLAFLESWKKIVPEEN